MTLTDFIRGVNIFLGVLDVGFILPALRDADTTRVRMRLCATAAVVSALTAGSVQFIRTDRPLPVAAPLLTFGLALYAVSLPPPPFWRAMRHPRRWLRKSPNTPRASVTGGTPCHASQAGCSTQ